MKKTTVVLMMLLGIYTAAGAAFYGNMVEEDAYLSASSLFEKKDYTAAAAEYAAFLEKFPESKYKAPSMLRMAELSVSAEEAMKHYNMVINGFAGSEYEAEAVFDLAKLFFAQEEYKKARAYFNIVISKFPSMVWVEESYYLLMLCAKAEGDTAIFEKAYDEYNSKGFFTFKNRVNLAYAGHLHETGKHPKALALYKELIDKTQGKDKNIHMPLVYRNAAESAKKAGDIQSAEMMESDLKFKYPDSPEAKGETAKAAPGAGGTVSQVKPGKTPVQEAAPAAAAAKEFYTVQIGAYSNKRLCDLMAEKLEAKKYVVFVKKDGKFFRLSVGRFATKQEADAFAPVFAKREKLKSWLVKQSWD